MSVATSNWQSRYTPAQLAVAANLHAIRRRQKAAMEARKAQIAAEEALRDERLKRQHKPDIDARTKEIAYVRKVNAEFRDAVRRGKVALKAKAAGNPHLYRVIGTETLSSTVIKSTALRVANAYGVSAGEILGPSRATVIATARAHLMVILCIENTHCSIAGVARALGRDHTTVMWALTRYNRHFGTSIRTCQLKIKPRVRVCPWQGVEVIQPQDGDQ